MTDFQDPPDPDLDTLTRDQLAEFPEPVPDVVHTLDEWLSRQHGITSSHHGVGLFLDLLAERGYRVEPIQVTQLTLPPPTE